MQVATQPLLTGLLSCRRRAEARASVERRLASGRSLRAYNNRNIQQYIVQFIRGGGGGFFIRCFGVIDVFVMGGYRGAGASHSPEIFDFFVPIFRIASQ